MKSTFFFFAILFTVAFCSKVENTIDSREFNEIIEDFVDIQKTANANVDIPLILSTLKINLDSSQKQYTDFLDGFIVSCNNAKVKLSNYLVSLRSQSDDTRNQAGHWRKEADKAFRDSSRNERMLNHTRELLQKVMQDMAQIIVEYHDGVGESDAKLTVIKQLNDIIEDELIKPTGRSFVQLKFHRRLDQLQALLQKTGDNFYTPVISTLVSLASETNFADQRILKQILLNIRNLRASIEKFKSEKEYAMNEKMVILKKQQENLQSQIGDFQHLAERYVSIVTEAHQNMDLLNKDFSNLQAEIQRKSGEMENLNHLCEEENTMYKKGIGRILEIKDGIRTALNLEQRRKQE